MNEEVLKQVLGEVLTELKNLNNEQKMINVALESYNERINEFQYAISNITIETPKIDIGELRQTIGKTQLEIKNIIAAQPKDIIHEKRILFYPEGDGRNFLKFIADKTILYTLIISGICLLCWIRLYFWKQNSENERYKYAYFWIYQNQRKNAARELLFETFNDFKNDSIFKIRKENIILIFDR
jgi:hypothetical protein